MSSIIDMLSRESGLADFSVRRIIQTAPLRYKVFYIPKKNGNLRRIAQPSREVKLLQRIMLEKFLINLPVHDSATAYRVGSGILANAKMHSQAGPILKMDFENFFPSIKKSDWILYCKRNSVLTSDDDIELTAKLFFQKQREYRTLRLAIGAPTSPTLSNILLFQFDRAINELIIGTKIKCSRYADDLTFSAPRVGYLKGVQTAVRKSLRALEFPKIKVNEKKTILITKKYRRVITGLIVTNDGNISVGRERRRKIRAGMDWAIRGKLDFFELRRLAGQVAFADSIESGFLRKLQEQYGFDNMSKVMACAGRKASSDINE